MKKSWFTIIKNFILIYTKKIKKYFKQMANIYDNSFIDADILDGKMVFTRVDGSKYSLQISQLQDTSTLKTVELINNSLTFTKISGDITSIDLSSYNGFDNVTLNSTTKDLVFYNNGVEVANVNFTSMINNSFISGNPFVSVDIIGNNMVFTMVNGDTRSISIHNLQEKNVISGVDIISDVIKFTKLNGNIKNIDLSTYKDIDDVTYDTNNMKMVFYKDGVIFKELDIKASFIDSISQIVINELSSEVSQRLSNDVIFSNALSLETSQRISNDDLFTSGLSQEISQRSLIDLNLASELSIEISTRTSVDNLLYNNLSTESSHRISSDVLLSNGLSSEVSLRTSSIKSLSTDVSSALLTEYIQRISTDLNLSTQISLETSYRISSDLVLKSTISTETNRRISTDIFLTGSILNNTVNINTATSKIEDINDIIFTELPIYDVSGNTLSGETIIRNNVEYLIEENDNKTTQIIDLYNNKSDITHTHKISAAEYKKTIKRYEIEWDNEWVKISHSTTFNFNTAHRVVNLVVFINKGFGLINLKPIINYGSTLSNNTTYTDNSFYISDTDGTINKNNDFDYIYLEYDIITDSNYRYDSKKYILGENAINDHYSSDAAHSRSTNFSFNAAYKQIDNTDFSGNLIESVYDPLVMGSLTRGFTPTFCALREANLVFHPYVNGAVTENIGSNPNILSVSSHYGNTFYRNDITPNAYMFLDNSIAVVARPNNITQIDRNDLKTKNFTSFGYGAEFLEEASNYKMNENYTHWTGPNAFSWGHIDETGYIVTNERNSSLLYSNYNMMEVEVGTLLGVGLSASDPNYQVRTIVEIIDDFNIRVDVPFNPLQPGVNYLIVHNAHIGTFWRVLKWNDYPTKQDSSDRMFWQSPTTGLVAGKFKKIKMMTDVSWGIVREAARKTAYLYDNTTTITTAITSNSNVNKIYVSNTDVFPDADPGFPDKVVGTAMVNGSKFYFKGKTSSYIYGDYQVIKNSTPINSEIKLIWDVYRGFGEIQVQDAIDYINNTYKSETYKKALADKLEGERNINPLLDYKNLYPNSPISKKMISDIGTDIKFTTIDEVAGLNNLGKIRYNRNGNTSVAQMSMQVGENQYEWINISNVNTW